MKSWPRSRWRQWGASVLVALAMLAGTTPVLPVGSVTAGGGQTFVVTSPDDPGDGTCDGTCTLREAIDAANANDNAGPDLITFAIPAAGVQTITLAVDLPDITEPVTIDGYTQSDAQENSATTGTDAVLQIQLTGPGVGVTNGLMINAGETTVRGLVIDHFFRGIDLAGATGATITGNFFGTDPTGTIAEPNERAGIVIENSSDNRVGGTAAADRNLISGNTGDGISVQTGSPGNRIQGNLIGTRANGATTMGNGGDGVEIDSTSGGYPHPR